MMSALYIVLVVFLVLANGFFVASEFALVGVRRSRIETVLHTISFTIAFTIITFLHIVLGELAPKTMALERAESVSLAVSWPLHAFYKFFQWPIRLLDWAGTRTVRLFGLHPSQDHASVYTEEELRHLVDISRRSGHLEAQEQQLINRVFEFSEAEVREAMVPRTNVDALPTTATLEETKAAFRTLGYSRLPVYRERIDDAVGVLFRRDIEPYLDGTRADE